MAHETHDRAKHRSDAKAKIGRLLADPKGMKFDASGYSPPDVMNAEEKTGPKKPVARAFKKGGKVEGEKAHHHAGRKHRMMGGPTDVPNVPTSGIYGNPTNAPTHAGMLSQAGGLKKGGKVRPDNESSDIHDGIKAEPRVARKEGGRLARNNGGNATKKNATKEEALQAAEHIINDARTPKVQKETVPGRYDDIRKNGGRTVRADGGRAKGKTNINIVIASPKAEPAQPPMPPMPPKPAGGIGGFPPPTPPGGGMLPPGAGPAAGPQGPLPPAMMGGGK